MPNLLHELRHAIRVLLKDRGFTAAALLTLSVCLGANSAIFTIVNAVLLRPLPVPDGQDIVLMANQYPKATAGEMNFSSGGDYFDRLKAVTALEDQASFKFGNQTVEINGSPERILSMAATPSFFRLVRTQPASGRAFTPEEGEPGNEQKAILSYGLWQQLFGGDPGVIGKSVRFSGRPHTIVGVMPRGFQFVNPEVRVWLPLAFTAEERAAYHSNNWYNAGRLKPGATLAQVQDQVNALNTANLERFPQMREILINAGFHTTVSPLQNMLVRNVKNSLYLLWGGAAFVLLIGAINIANLSLARLNLRRRELATRLALGAGRIHLATQLLAENLTLGLAGGVGGLLFAAGILGGLGRFGLDQLPRASEIHLEAATVLFTFAIAALTGVLIGLIPLAQVFHINLNSAIREDSRAGAGGRQSMAIRRLLIVTQIGFAMVLVAGAGLLLASFRQLLQVDPGFRSEGVLTASVRFPRARYATEAQLRAVTNRALEAFRHLPGVTVAGYTSAIPFGGEYSDSVIFAEGYLTKPGESLISPKKTTISPGYMEAMGIRLVRGRYFADSDHETARKVILIDERLAKKFWPNQDPIGRRMYYPTDIKHLTQITDKTEMMTVVGIVRPIQLEDLAGTPNSVGACYLPFAQNTWGGGTFSVRANTNAAGLAAMMRAEMAKIDPEVALFEVRTMAERTELSLASRKSAMLLAAGFGMLALFLAAIGIYGVLAYLVAQRNREIGIRLALGSSQAGIFGLLLREGLAMVTVGLLLGLAGASFLSSVVQKQFYGVESMHPLVLSLAAVLLGVVGLAACIVPARHAMAVNPVSVLHEQ